MPQKTTTTNNTAAQSQTNPWGPQIPYLTQGFQDASNLYNGSAGDLYKGQQIAQYTPDQLNAFQSMLNYGTGNTNIPTTSANTGATLANAGASGITNALNHLASFTPQGGTQSNIDAATQYANNPAIPGMVQAAMRDSMNTASEQTLPGIARNAAAGGDINSNRTAIQNGIVQRGLNNEAGDISANLRGTAYNNGLNLAEQNSEANNSAMLNAFNALAGNSTNAASTGVNAGTASIGQQGGLFDTATQGIVGQNTAAQAGDSNAQAVSQNNSSTPLSLLQQYMGLIGSNYGGGSSSGTGTSTGTQTTQASPLSIAASIAGGLGSFMVPGLGGVSGAGNLMGLLTKGTAGFK